MINSTADKVSALIKALERRGLGDQALEVATKFSELDNVTDKMLPLETRHLKLILSCDERRPNCREQLRAQYYSRIIKPEYECLLS